MPRRANAAARLTAVVVLPAPPFWLTTARTAPMLLQDPRDLAGLQLGSRRWRLGGLHLIESFLCMLDPALCFRTARGIHEERLEVIRGIADVTAPEQEKRQTVVRA